MAQVKKCVDTYNEFDPAFIDCAHCDNGNTSITRFYSPWLGCPAWSVDLQQDLNPCDPATFTQYGEVVTGTIDPLTGSPTIMASTAATSVINSCSTCLTYSSGDPVPPGTEWLNPAIGEVASRCISEEPMIHKFAEEAIYKHIAYAILSTKTNIPEYVVSRFKKERFAETRKAKLRLSNIKLEEITRILRGKSKQIKH